MNTLAEHKAVIIDQMYVAFRVVCSKVVQGCLVVMRQDAREFLHERNLCQRFDVLPLHWNIKHPMPTAEIANICLTPVHAHCSRVRAYLRQVEQMILDLFLLDFSPLVQRFKPTENCLSPEIALINSTILSAD